MEKCAILLWDVMCERFLKFIPTDEAFWLMQHKPNAFLLLSHIANTARRKLGHPDGLLIGQCHLQHWTFYGFTERQYRTAKQILVERKHIVIIETNRTRKKSTTGTTTKSTLVQICSLTVYDINPELIDDRNDDRETTERRLNDDKQEGIRSISPKVDIQEVAQTAKRLRSKDVLSFDFEKWEFTGITEKDLSDWKLMYPHIEIPVETLKAAQWLKSNQSKSNKKNFRKFLTGWYGRSNESIENKKAYRFASGGTTQDRKTKNMDGTPIKSRAEELF
jgi:hypothetical protein